MPQTRTPVTREDVIRLLGDVDEMVLAEILASGITLDELVAQARERELDAWDDEDEYRD